MTEDDVAETLDCMLAEDHSVGSLLYILYPSFHSEQMFIFSVGHDLQFSIVHDEIVRLIFLVLFKVAFIVDTIVNK